MTSLEACRLCPRSCGVDRTSGRTGWCGAGPLIRVARASLHLWEEPPISGTRGSGTVFFSRCNLHCLFCQNHEISRGGTGRDLTPSESASLFLDLQAQGAHNINLVSPTPYIPQIAEALRLAREQGLVLPVVYNTNAYELPAALRMLEGLVQVFLPDLKYADDGLSRTFSDGPGYFAAATAAIQAMRELAPADILDEQGIMQAGLIVRHLVLPGQGGDTRLVLRWIADHLGPETYVSLMAQYTPAYQAAGHAMLGRRLRAAEYEETLEAFAAAGLVNGFCQEAGSASSAFTPEFDLTGLPDPAGRCAQPAIVPFLPPSPEPPRPPSA